MKQNPKKTNLDRMAKKKLVIGFLFLILTIDAYANVGGGMLWDHNARFTFLHYFISLFITIVLELFVASLYFHKWKIPQRNLEFIVLCSLLTHPMFWFIGEKINWNGTFVASGEISIVFIEFFILVRFLKEMLPKEYLFLISAAMNITSALIGGIIYLIITSIL